MSSRAARRATPPTTAAATSEQAYTSESVDKSYTIVNPYSPSSTQGVMWSYPQFSKVDGSTDAALDALNAQLAKACEDDANLGKAWGPASGAMMVDDHQDLCASINGSIASVFSARDETGGGAHGTDESFGTFYDLSTGKAVDVTTALNMSVEDLQAKELPASTPSSPRTRVTWASRPTTSPRWLASRTATSATRRARSSSRAPTSWAPTPSARIAST